MAQELGSFIGTWRTRGGQIAEVKEVKNNGRLVGTIDGGTLLDWWDKDGRAEGFHPTHECDLMERLDGRVK